MKMGKVNGMVNGQANGGGPESALTEDPKAAGLKDGGVIAFRLVGDEEWVVELPKFEDEVMNAARNA